MASVSIHVADPPYQVGVVMHVLPIRLTPACGRRPPRIVIVITCVLGPQIHTPGRGHIGSKLQLLRTHVRASALDKLALAPKALAFKMGDGGWFFELTYYTEIVSQILHKWNCHGSLNINEIATIRSFHLETVPLHLRTGFNPPRGGPISDWSKVVFYEQGAGDVVIIVPQLSGCRSTVVYQQRQELAEVISLLGLKTFEKTRRP